MSTVVLKTILVRTNFEKNKTVNPTHIIRKYITVFSRKAK